MIKMLSTPAELSRFSRDKHREGKRVALIPTMGNLHEGHLALIRAACAAADVVIVSIFVNPTQFGPSEDFEKYPRTLQDDLTLIADVSTVETAVFHPEPGIMYADDRSVWVTEESLSSVLCGLSRPIHFRGVLTVVAKLFNAAQPDSAFFGQKDAQQALLIRRMIRDLDYPVELHICPIVRESDGLAMSSRNRFLSPSERASAPGIRAAILEAGAAVGDGKLATPEAVKNFLTGRIGQIGQIGEIDYIELADIETLKNAVSLSSPVLIAVAVRMGQTRLIDNHLLGTPKL